MSEMIERVAEAIYETEPYGISATKEMPWSDVHESQKEGFRVKARAAIEAMMEPTERMISEGESAASFGLGRPADEEALPRVWKWMLQAALNEVGQ